MLNPFSDLLALGFLAPTILRVAVGCLFLYAGYYHWTHRSTIGNISFPLIGRGEWIASASALAHVAVGAMFVFGYYVQIAALLGALSALKGLIMVKKFEIVFPYSRSTYVLIIAISFSLLLSGAGLFAFDVYL